MEGDQNLKMDVKNLIKVWEFFAWADKSKMKLDRMLELAFRRGTECVDGLQPGEIVLAFWLTYIYDYRVPANQVWRNMFPIIAWVSHEYSTSLHKYKNIEDLLDAVRGDDSNEYRLRETRAQAIGVRTYHRDY